MAIERSLHVFRCGKNDHFHVERMRMTLRGSDDILLSSFFMQPTSNLWTGIVPIFSSQSKYKYQHAHKISV